jgi:hypothetical protein
MSAPPGPEVPTFSECVIGYRAWWADEADQLWPIGVRRRPWAPGINTARCNCGTWDSLRFEWSWHEGRRVLEPAPEHPAPQVDCECGLYSWRRPNPSWRRDSGWWSLPWVTGAVASWGALQVHDGGFRAEHACVVTLAWHPEAPPETVAALGRIARRYRADLVPFDVLEEAASRHGTPLPDDLRPPPEDPPAPAVIPGQRFRALPARDATPDEVVMPPSPPGLVPNRSFINPQGN